MPAVERASYEILPAPHHQPFPINRTSSDELVDYDQQQYYASTPILHHHNHHHHARPTTYHPPPPSTTVYTKNDHLPHRITSTQVYTQPQQRGKQHKAVREPVRNVTTHDVLCGRGVNIAHHPGNERFRTLVTGRQDDSYCTSYSATEKRAVAEEIIKHIKALDPPGRFLKRDGRGQVSRGLKGPWEELTEKEAVKKTCQALRDCNRVDRQGYAAGVAPPQDVMMSLKKRAMTGMTGKQHAAAAAAANAASIAAAAANMSFKRNKNDILPQQGTKQYMGFEENAVNPSVGSTVKYFPPNPRVPGFRDSVSSHLSQENIENITRVVDDTHPRISPGVVESIPRQYNEEHREQDPQWSKEDPTQWPKKQRTEPYNSPIPSPEGVLPLHVHTLPQNVIYDSTHQEFHKVWTQTDPQTQSPPIQMSNDCLSTVISKEVMPDDYHNVTPHQPLSSDVQNHLPDEICHSELMNPDINALRPDITQDCTINRIDLQTPAPSLHVVDLTLAQSDIQPTPVSALKTTLPPVLSKHLPSEMDEFDSIPPHNLDQASKLIMNTPISNAKEDALLQNDSPICPASPVPLSSDL